MTVTTIESLSSYELSHLTSFLSITQISRLHICGAQVLTTKLENGGVLDLAIFAYSNPPAVNAKLLQQYQSLRSLILKSPRWLLNTVRVDWHALPSKLTRIEIHTNSNFPKGLLDFETQLPMLKHLIITLSDLESITNTLPKGLLTLDFLGASPPPTKPLILCLPASLTKLKFNYPSEQPHPKLFDGCNILDHLTQLESLTFIARFTPRVPSSVVHLDFILRDKTNRANVQIQELPSGLKYARVQGDVSPSFLHLLPTSLESLVLDNEAIFSPELCKSLPPTLTSLEITRKCDWLCWNFLPKSLKRLNLVTENRALFNFADRLPHLESLVLHYSSLAPEAGSVHKWFPHGLKRLRCAELEISDELDPNAPTLPLPPSLTELHIRVFYGHQGIDEVRSLSRDLAILSVPIEFVPPPTWIALPRLLTELSLVGGFGSPVIDVDETHALCLPPRLTSLDVRGSRIIISQGFWAALHLPELTSLSVGTQGGHSVEILRHMPKGLKTLSMQIYGALKDEHLQHLPPSLVELSISLTLGPMKSENLLSQDFPKKLPASLKRALIPLPQGFNSAYFPWLFISPTFASL